MKIIKYGLVSSVALLLVALLAGSLYLQFADLNRHKPAIEAQLSRLLARDIRIAGELQLELFPAVFILLEQCSIANAAWGSEPYMAEVGTLSARIKPWSLLASPLRITDLHLSDIKVLIEANAEGVSNWDFKPTAEDAVAGRSSSGAGNWSGLILDRADLSKVRVVKRQPGIADRVLHLDTATLDTAVDGAIAMQVEGHALDMGLQLEGHSAAPGAMSDNVSKGFNVAGHWGDLKLQLEGSRHALGNLDRAHLTAKLKTDKVKSISSALGLSLPFSGPMELDAKLQPGKKVNIRAAVNAIDADFNFELGKRAIVFDGTVTPLDKLGDLFELTGLPPQALSMSGRARPGPATTELSDIALTLADNRLTVDGSLSKTDKPSKLQVQATGTTLSQLHRTLPELAYQASGRVSLAANTIAITDLQASFGDSDLSGALQLQRQKPILLKAELQSRLLDLQPFQAKRAAGAKARAALESSLPKKKSRYFLSEEPLPLDALAAIDADLKMRIEKLLSRQSPLSKLKLDVALRQGDLQAQVNFVGVNNGRSANTIRLNTSGSVATVDIMLQGENMRLNLAGDEVSDYSRLPPTDMTVKLTSRGSSAHTLAAGANGVVVLSQGRGQVTSGFLDTFSSDLLTQLVSVLNPFSKPDGKTEWECSIYRFNVIDGLADIAALYAQTKKVEVVGDGSIDFNTEQLNIEFATRPREGVGVSADMLVAPFVALKGTLAKPQIGLNQKGILLTGGTAIATGGLSLLWKAAADRAAGAFDRCDQYKAEFAQHPALPNP